MIERHENEGVGSVIALDATPAPRPRRQRPVAEVCLTAWSRRCPADVPVERRRRAERAVGLLPPVLEPHRAELHADRLLHLAVGRAGRDDRRDRHVRHLDDEPRVATTAGDVQLRLRDVPARRDEPQQLRGCRVEEVLPDQRRRIGSAGTAATPTPRRPAGRRSRGDAPAPRQQLDPVLVPDRRRLAGRVGEEREDTRDPTSSPPSAEVPDPPGSRRCTAVYARRD